MMIDKELMLSDMADITTTSVSDVIDCGGQGKCLFLPLMCQVAEDFVGGKSVTVLLETSDDAAFANPVSLLSSAAIGVDVLQKGYQFAISYLPYGSLRYIRLKYVVDGTMTTGKINACICGSLQSNM